MLNKENINIRKLKFFAVKTILLGIDLRQWQLILCVCVPFFVLLHILHITFYNLLLLIRALI